jgi:hypothetical protein
LQGLTSQSPDDLTTSIYNDVLTNDITTKAVNEGDMLQNIFSGNEDEMQNVFFSFCLLSIPTVVLALASNGLAFLVSIVTNHIRSIKLDPFITYYLKIKRK